MRVELERLEVHYSAIFKSLFTSHKYPVEPIASWCISESIRPGGVNVNFRLFRTARQNDRWFILQNGARPTWTGLSIWHTCTEIIMYPVITEILYFLNPLRRVKPNKLNYLTSLFAYNEKKTSITIQIFRNNNYKKSHNSINITRKMDV